VSASEKLLDSLHTRVDDLLIDLNQNLTTGLLSVQLPSAPLHLTREADISTPTPQVALNSLKMQLSTEKVIVNVQQVLRLITEIRGIALVHDQAGIQDESKHRFDATKDNNRHEIIQLTQRYSELENLEEQAH
jgi:Surfeit locus protein 5 subunit 22 of Mediator complex